MRLYKKIAQQLQERILNGDYPQGSVLPPERELAKQLGVSRSSVREAVIALEVEGWVEVKIGSGIYIRSRPYPTAHSSAIKPIDPELAPYLSPSEEIPPFSLLSARRYLEPEIAALAAENHTPEMLSAIQQAYMMNVQDNFAGSTTHAGDRLFHIRIAEASGNDAYAEIMRHLLGHSYGEMFSALQRYYTPEDMPLRSQVEHLTILAALQQRKAEAAREAMQAHLDSVIAMFMQRKYK